MRLEQESSLRVERREVASKERKSTGKRGPAPTGNARPVCRGEAVAETESGLRDDHAANDRMEVEARRAGE
eukprot:4557564-Pleurochrysis_carterae.AAC.2